MNERLPDHRVSVDETKNRIGLTGIHGDIFTGILEEVALETGDDPRAMEIDLAAIEEDHAAEVVRGVQIPRYGAAQVLTPSKN